MRAWQVQRHGSPTEALTLTDIDEPSPGPGEMRVTVQAVAIGAPDAFMCQSTYRLTPPLPFVAGQEVCGIVDEVGEGVDVPVGSRVMAVTNFFDGRGGFAEKTIVRPASAYRVPDGMHAADAAGFRIGYSTGWIGIVRRGQLQAGENLLVLGAAGGSGITAVQLGAARGARVIAVAAGPDKLDFCRSMGAEVLIDRTTEDVPKAVLAATGGKGANVIYDPVGGDAAEAALRCIAPFGRMLAVGFASGSWVDVNTAHAVQYNDSLVGVYASGLTRAQNEEDHEALLSLHQRGKLASFVQVRLFEELPQAIEDVAASRVIGKLAVVP